MSSPWQGVYPDNSVPQLYRWCGHVLGTRPRGGACRAVRAGCGPRAPAVVTGLASSQASSGKGHSDPLGPLGVKRRPLVSQAGQGGDGSHLDWAWAWRAPRSGSQRQTAHGSRSWRQADGAGGGRAASGTELTPLQAAGWGQQHCPRRKPRALSPQATCGTPSGASPGRDTRRHTWSPSYHVARLELTRYPHHVLLNRAGGQDGETGHCSAAPDLRSSATGKA